MSEILSENLENFVVEIALFILQCTTGKETEAVFHAIRRLVASRAGFAAFTSLPGFREKLGLKVSLISDDDIDTYFLNAQTVLRLFR